MYYAHFGLKEEPFGPSPDPRFFYHTEQHQEALATLYYGIQQRRGFSLLLGRAGLGKTSVLTQLLQMLENKAETAYLPHPYFDRATLLDSILLSLGLGTSSSIAQRHRMFYEYLMELRLSGKTCALIFDEAQDFDLRTLEAIRMLSNFETASEKLVQIVLSGQPRLGETLAQPECEQLRQRINVVARLEPLSIGNVPDYIAHRVTTAGATTSLFTAEAVTAIAAASGGVPRNVNNICFNSLTLAFALDRHQVGKEEVTEVLRDFNLTAGAPPVCNSSVAASLGATQSAVVTVRRPTMPVQQSPTLSVRFGELKSSFRPALIAATLVLLAAGTLLSRVVGKF